MKVLVRAENIEFQSDPTTRHSEMLLRYRFSQMDAEAHWLDIQKAVRAIHNTARSAFVSALPPGTQVVFVPEGEFGMFLDELKERA